LHWVKKIYLQNSSVNPRPSLKIEVSWVCFIHDKLKEDKMKTAQDMKMCTAN